MFCLDEWFLVGIKLNSLIALRKFLASPAVVGFICLPSYCSLYESPSGFSVMRLHPGIYKNTEGGIFTNHSPDVKEGSHWVLAAFPFVHELWPTQFNGSEEI